MSKNWIGLAAAVAMCAATTGCIGAEDEAPGFDKGQGQDVALTNVAYPEGPFGFNEGSIVPNLEFLGYPDFVNRPGELRVTRLSDFYNPTGLEVYGPELGYYGEGQYKPKALIMLISSVWCPPCREEAANVLPGQYTTYKPLGGQFMSILIDGKDPGTPVTIDEMTSWASTYQPAYTQTMDPSGEVMAWYEPAFPGNIIIRTSDMKIIRRVAGVPNALFWNTFNLVLTDQYVDPEEPMDPAE